MPLNNLVHLVSFYTDACQYEESLEENGETQILFRNDFNHKLYHEFVGCVPTKDESSTGSNSTVTEGTIVALACDDAFIATLIRFINPENRKLSAVKAIVVCLNLRVISFAGYR